MAELIIILFFTSPIWGSMILIAVFGGALSHGIRESRRRQMQVHGQLQPAQKSQQKPASESTGQYL